MWQDEGRTLLTLLLVVEAVWFALVLTLIIVPERWHERAAKSAPAPMPVDAQRERKAA
jgi:hypothetical protein